MLRYALASLAGGVLFLVLDGVLNANPLARRLLSPFAPIARPSVNALAGSLLDLAYGFILAWLFLMLAPALPGTTGHVKGLSFGLLVWFLRVFMSAAAQWVMFRLPAATLGYMLAAGLVEMLALGALWGGLLS